MNAIIPAPLEGIQFWCTLSGKAREKRCHEEMMQTVAEDLLIQFECKITELSRYFRENVIAIWTCFGAFIEAFLYQGAFIIFLQRIFGQYWHHHFPIPPHLLLPPLLLPPKSHPHLTLIFPYQLLPWIPHFNEPLCSENSHHTWTIPHLKIQKASGRNSQLCYRFCKTLVMNL